MELYVLNLDLYRIGIVDVYESFLWNVAYNRVGNWELRCPLDYAKLLQTDRIIQNSEDHSHNGLIEYVEKITDEDGVENLLVKGRTLEALLERRITKGEFVYQSYQPAEILRNLVTRNIISPSDTTRKIENLVLGTTANADQGVTSYACANLPIVSAAESLCQEAQLGFALRADPIEKKLIFDIYKGANRTEADNTETSIMEVTINAQTIVNWDFSSALTSWTVEDGSPRSITASGGILRKTKVWDHWQDEITGERFSIPLRSAYVYQEVQLSKDHIYYIVVKCNNPTESMIGFGIKTADNACTFQVQNEGDAVRTALFVPDTTATHTFALGYGDLSDDPDKEGVFLTVDYSAVIDLTATFGTGKEPVLSWCRENIYYANGWKYKIQTTYLVPNGNDPLVFSRDRDSLLTVEYSKSIASERTVMYIQGDGIDTVITEGGEGATRKEVFLDLSGSIKRTMDGITIPQASYIAMLQREGRAAMRSLGVQETVDGTIYLLNNKKYRQDYFLGDLVNCQDSKVGFSVTLRISETQESWDTSGYTLSVVLGEDVPNIYETIKLVTKGAK